MVSSFFKFIQYPTSYSGLVWAIFMKRACPLPPLPSKTSSDEPSLMLFALVRLTAAGSQVSCMSATFVAAKSASSSWEARTQGGRTRSPAPSFFSSSATLKFFFLAQTLASSFSAGFVTTPVVFFTSLVPEFCLMLVSLEAGSWFFELALVVFFLFLAHRLASSFSGGLEPTWSLKSHYFVQF